MNIIYKILLSIPSFLTLSYMFIFHFFVDLYNLIAPNMSAYSLQNFILLALTIVQLIILIMKLWSLKTVPKSIKQDWTGILIFFSSISAFIFIWFNLDRLIRLEESNTNQIEEEKNSI